MSKPKSVPVVSGVFKPNLSVLVEPIPTVADPVDPIVLYFGSQSGTSISSYF